MSKRQKQTTSNPTASRAGYVNIADILMKKLDAKAAAPEFSSSSTYSVNERVTYLGRLYKCTAAVDTAGDWTGSTNWEEINLSSPPPVATDSTPGIVKPDGTTITVDENGVISSSGGGGGGGGLEGHTVTLTSGAQGVWTNIILVKTDGTFAQYFTGDIGGVESNVFLYIIETQQAYSDLGMAIDEVRLVTGDIALIIPASCLQKGTKVTLSNMTTKPIEEITYDDELLVWDFDNGKFSSAKPLWIKSMQVSPFYFRNKFSDGRTLMTVGEPSTGGHRLFNLSKSMFTYSKETVGDEVYSLDGRISHVSCERVDEPCEFYNVITDRHMNLFANGILTSCRFNNLYTVKDMKFVKDERKLRPFEIYKVPIEYYNGLRLGEQTMDIAEVNKYVGNLVNIAVERKI